MQRLQCPIYNGKFWTLDTLLLPGWTTFPDLKRETLNFLKFVAALISGSVTKHK